jgi:hypothetical protein
MGCNFSCRRRPLLPSACDHCGSLVLPKVSRSFGSRKLSSRGLRCVCEVSSVVFDSPQMAMTDTPKVCYLERLVQSVVPARGLVSFVDSRFSFCR